MPETPWKTSKMNGMRWWDDAEIVLLAHTGNVELAEQFASWCRHADEVLLGLMGFDAEAFNDACTRFVRDNWEVP